MRVKWVILLLLPAFMLMLAGTGVPAIDKNGGQYDDVTQSDTIIPEARVVALPQQIGDSIMVQPPLPSLSDTISLSSDGTASEHVADTTLMDSLELAIYHHNKQIDDSLHLDSLNRARSNGIESPVVYSANDSLVYDALSKTAHLYGKGNVDYQNMNLKSEKVYMSLDSSLVYATGVADSTEKTGLKGTPLVKWGKDEYELDTITFNFKTKKGFINNVYTEQEDGYLRSEHSKRDDAGNLYLEHGTYTTCDEEHPDFYIALSRAKVRPGKDVVFGPAYLVVADVPLPLAIPYGFFPFTKKYSSGFIMPTYGDESTRGFYLRDGGYYFAISDRMDLKLLGEIYTKGSWGISVATNYVKRYRYNGSFYFSYQNTETGDKGMPDYNKTESFKVQWQHNQDTKANPYNTFKASVNFTTSNYERNNLTSLYNPQAITQSIRTSSVSYGTKFSNLGLSLNTTLDLSQNTRDSLIYISFPELNISSDPIYPFKRKHAAGKERWYEKISIKYTGRLSNSIEAHEDKILHSNLVKDWRNGMLHTIPIQTTFTLFKYINVTPQFNFTDRMYTKKVMRSWDEDAKHEVADTLHGFYNVYDWSMSINANTKIYGNFIPNKKIFGDKIIAVRHVLTPSIGFSYAPDFGAEHYGYVKSYQYTDADGNVSLVKYSPYQGALFSLPNTNGKTGSITFRLSNNIEMKVKSDKDSTGVKKVSIIDDLSMDMSYNIANKERPWSNLNTNIRLKWWKNYTFNMHAVFATYAYDLDENGRPYVGTHTEYSRGRFGRFQGTDQTFSYTLTPEKLKKLFGGGSDDDEEEETEEEDEGLEVETNIDDKMIKAQRNRKKKSSMAETDEDGYMSFKMPWSLSLGYSISMRENTAGTFNKKRMRYPYKFTQMLNVSGFINISDGWKINFMSGYDFDNHKISMTTVSLARDLHCFSMSCQVTLAPYTSYNFSFRCNAATLTDALKYDKRSNSTNAVRWY